MQPKLKETWLNSVKICQTISNGVYSQLSNPNFDLYVKISTCDLLFRDDRSFSAQPLLLAGSPGAILLGLSKLATGPFHGIPEPRSS